MSKVETYMPICLKMQHSQLLTSDQDDEIARKPKQINNRKLKNELCRNFQLYGFCRYNDKCQFAHGIQQLRQFLGATTNCKYKTKECQAYFNKGYCHYGERCNFIHHKIGQKKSMKIRINLHQFREIVENARIKSRFFNN